MKKVSMLLILATGLVLTESGCGIFESGDNPDSVKKFYRTGKDAASRGGKGGAAGDAEFGGGANGPGAYGNDPGAGVGEDCENFGTRIPGVQFEAVHFNFDQSRIESSEIAKLDAVADYLQKNPGTGVVIEGHCDARGSEDYNRSLGDRRAIVAQEHLTNVRGIDPSRMMCKSYGKLRLLDAGNAEASHAKNRRDEFIAVKLYRK